MARAIVKVHQAAQLRRVGLFHGKPIFPHPQDRELGLANLNAQAAFLFHTLNTCGIQRFLNGPRNIGGHDACLPDVDLLICNESQGDSQSPKIK
jgi:hypothetical protein